MDNKFYLIDDYTIIIASNWTFKARLNEENIIIVKNQSRFSNKFQKIKPQYAFAINGNDVTLLPIEKIMAKWERTKETKPVITRNTNRSIFDKF